MFSNRIAAMKFTSVRYQSTSTTIPQFIKVKDMIRNCCHYVNTAAIKTIRFNDDGTSIIYTDFKNNYHNGGIIYADEGETIKLKKLINDVE